MLEYIDLFKTYFPDVISVIAHVIAIASIIVKWTPTEADDRILNAIIQGLKKLSLYKE